MKPNKMTLFWCVLQNHQQSPGDFSSPPLSPFNKASSIFLIDVSLTYSQMMLEFIELQNILFNE